MATGQGRAGRFEGGRLRVTENCDRTFSDAAPDRGGVLCGAPLLFALTHNFMRAFMPKLTVFNQVTLDGYFSGTDGDYSWAHRPGNQDPEWLAFVQENARGGGRLLFGRKTYQIMANWWPTPQAAAAMPAVAERMNGLEKVVFSRTLKEASWRNTRLVGTSLTDEIRRMKADNGPDMAILGSGSIVGQLAEAGLVDQFQVAINPVVLGSGRTMFSGVTHRLDLRRTSVRNFGNGNVVVCYEPAG